MNFLLLNNLGVFNNIGFYFYDTILIINVIRSIFLTSISATHHGYIYISKINTFSY